MKRTHPKIDFGAALAKLADFPGNPMASNVISDRLQALKGNSLLALVARECVKTNNLTGAINLILESDKDNKQLAERVFGADLIREVKEFVRERRAESVDDIPAQLYKSPGMFGYLAD